MFIGAVLAYANMGYGQSTVPMPTTVTDEIFRSRWVGPQMDRPALPQPTPQSETAEGTPETGLEAKIDELATTLINRGIYIGPVNVHPGFGVGWEYSSGNNQGYTTDQSSGSSFFLSPSLGLVYSREIGPWSVSAAYGVGFKYYLNPDYTAAGTGSQRNPFSQTGSLNLGHIGLRHKITLSLGTSYGTGQDILANETVTQFTFNSKATWDYALTEFTGVGAKAAYNNTTNSQITNDNTIQNYLGETFVDYLWTSKSRVRLTLGAGQSVQTFGSDTLTRQYGQALASIKYEYSPKLNFDVGAGLRYVEDSRVIASKYTGLQPAYRAAVNYLPTEKTSIEAKIWLEGIDVGPSFRLQAAWQPRVTTALSVAVYQTQNLSTSTFANIQISRGFVGTITQQVFSKIDLRLSGGWQQTENLSLSEDQPDNADTNYGFAIASARWNVRDWAFMEASYYVSSGSQYQGTNGNEPETRTTISLNLTF